MENKWTKIIEEGISKQEHNTGLDQDLWNALGNLSLRITVLRSGKYNDELKPLPTFEEYLAEKAEKGYKPNEIELYRLACKPEAIAAYDALVKEFNSKLDSLKDNIEMLKEYENKFKEMIYGKK